MLYDIMVDKTKKIMHIINENFLTSEYDVMEGIEEMGVPLKEVVFSNPYLDRKKSPSHNVPTISSDFDVVVFLGTVSQQDIGVPPALEELSEFDLLTGYVPGWYISLGDEISGKEVYIIVINVGICKEQEIDIFNTLKHELLHIENEEHCNNKGCLFSQDTSNDNFCSECDVKFKKIIKNLKEKNV